jgi:hypothetical protein
MSSAVPLSQLIESAVDSSCEETIDLREICFELEAACRQVGLQVEHRFDEMSGAPVPEEICSQLWGRSAGALMEIEYLGQEWKIVSIDLPAEFDGLREQTIPIGHTPRWLGLVRSDSIIQDLEEPL